CQSYISSPLTF
nr:immunoglobulin light chain junction region [Macaca mulatta]MOW63800.1 immunoglobulin light chain junction region [Macaca mulatta]